MYTAINLVLPRPLKAHASSGGGPHVDEPHIHVGSATSDDKNDVLLAYVGPLVGRGAVGLAEMNFVPVGNIPMLVDSMFPICVPLSLLAA